MVLTGAAGAIVPTWIGGDYATASTSSENRWGSAAGAWAYRSLPEFIGVYPAWRGTAAPQARKHLKFGQIWCIMKKS